MNVGDVVRIKVTGETVQITTVYESTLDVFRALTSRDGLKYETVTIPLDGVETVEENIQREFKEAMFRHSLMSKGLGDNVVATGERFAEEIN